MIKVSISLSGGICDPRTITIEDGALNTESSWPEIMMILYDAFKALGYNIKIKDFQEATNEESNIDRSNPYRNADGMR